jgi:hypothetical protein
MAEVTAEMEKDLELWETTFKPIQNPNGDMGWNGTMFETYGEDLAFIAKQPDANIWTWVDGDEGTWIMSGFHYINRIGYFVTENPCTQEYMEIQVDIYEEEEEEEENA